MDQDVVWVPYSVWWGMPGDECGEDRRGIYPSHRGACEDVLPGPATSVPPINGMTQDHVRFLFERHVNSRRSRPWYREKYTYDVMIEVAIPKKDYAEFLLVYDIDLIDNTDLYQ